MFKLSSDIFNELLQIVQGSDRVLLFSMFIFFYRDFSNEVSLPSLSTYKSHELYSPSQFHFWELGKVLIVTKELTFISKKCILSLMSLSNFNIEYPYFWLTQNKWGDKGAFLEKNMRRIKMHIFL